MTCSARIIALATVFGLLAAPGGSLLADTPPLQEHPLHRDANAAWRTVVVPAPAGPKAGSVATSPSPAVSRPPAPGVRAKGPATETASLSTSPSTTRKPLPKLLGPGHALDGIASYYWQDQMTATGERFDKTAMTAAHRTLPFGTKVRVTHSKNGRFVVVRINDRGPFKKGRVIDLSEAAAKAIGMTSAGLAHVKIDVIAAR